MENFIRSNYLLGFKFYGVSVRLDVIFVDNEATLYVVSIRTTNRRDEETLCYNSAKEAKSKFKEIIAQYV